MTIVVGALSIFLVGVAVEKLKGKPVQSGRNFICIVMALLRDAKNYLEHSQANTNVETFLNLNHGTSRQFVRDENL